jgi:hypothetical protein
MGWGASNPPGGPIEPFSQPVRIVSAGELGIEPSASTNPGLIIHPPLIPEPPAMYGPDSRVSVDELAQVLVELIWQGDDGSSLWDQFQGPTQDAWRENARRLMNRYTVTKKD